MCGDRALAKDVIQNLFLELWEKQSLPADVRHWNAYLRKALHRKMVKTLKKKNLYFHDIPESGDFLFAPSYEELLIEFQTNEAKKRDINIALQQLSEAQRRVLRLRFFEEMSYDDIAAETNTSKQTVYNQAFAAIKKLRITLLDLVSQ